MKTSLAIALCIFGLSTLAPANESKTHTPKAAHAVQAKIFNSICPISGEKVDPNGPTVEYKGKRIAFCCPGCIKTFQSDPEKYLQNLSSDGQKWVGQEPAGM